MRTRVAILVSLFALAGLAGCVDDPEEISEDPAPDDPRGSQAPFAQPASWSLGQWWRYTTTSTDGAGEPVELVVSEVGSDAYTLDTTGREMAAFEEEFDVSYVGPIRKTDLAGRQGNDDVEYFRFPLTEGKNWTTRWDGVERTVRVESVGETRVQMAALEDDFVRVLYSYDNQSGFFGHMVFFLDDGQTQFEMTLAGSGGNFTGKYLRSSTEEVLADGGGSGPAAADFMVQNGTHELVVRYEVNCTEVAAGRWEIALTPTQTQTPQDDQLRFSGECPAAMADEVVTEAPTEGTWAYTALYGGPTGGALTHQVNVLARMYTEAAIG